MRAITIRLQPMLVMIAFMPRDVSLAQAKRTEQVQ